MANLDIMSTRQMIDTTFGAADVSTTSIMSIREMIDNTFGAPDANTVNFKLLRTILYILARKLNILTRHVRIEVERRKKIQEIMVFELNIHSKPTKKRSKGKGQKYSTDTSSTTETSGQKSTTDKNAKYSTETSLAVESSLINSSDKSSTDKNAKYSTGTSAAVESSAMYTSDKSSTDKDAKYSTGTSAAVESSTIYSSEKSTTDKNAKYSTVTSAAVESYAMYTSDKSSTDKNAKYSTGTSAAVESYAMYSSDKSSTDKNAKYSTGTSSAVESSAMYSSDKSSTDKNAKYSTGTSSVVESSALYSSDKSSTDKNAKYSTGTSSAVEASANSSDKFAVDKYAKYFSKTYAAGKSSTSSTTTDTDKMKKGGSDNRQTDRTRTSSEDDRDSMEILREKLLVVSRKASDDSAYSDGDQQGESARSGAGTRFGDGTRKRASFGADQLTVATQDQYYDLVEEICELQAMLGLETDIALVIGHTQAGQRQLDVRAKLHKPTSLTHPMAAVNMSARLESAEKQLAKLMSTAIRLAKRTSGINVESVFDDSFLEQKEMSNWGLPGLSSHTPPPLTKSRASKQTRSAIEGTEESQAFNVYDEDDLPEESKAELESASRSQITGGISSEQVKAKKITYEELKECMDELYDEMLKKYTNVTNLSSNISGATSKQMVQLGGKLEATLNLDDKINQLEQSVEDYADTVNYIDTTLSSQMTKAQEAITQMQFDLAAGLDYLSEALSAPSKMVDAIAKLNEQFTFFHVDLTKTEERQKELKLLQETSATDLDDLKRKLKELEDIKASRAEAEEALSNKATIAALNGMVHQVQFDAVRGDFEKRIISAYDIFNNTEIVWQKSLDDLTRFINDKAEILQLISLKREIQKYLTKLMSDAENLREIIGEMEISTVTRKLKRFDHCLSCGASVEAYEDVFGENMLLRPPVIGAESADVKEDVARKFCVPGRPVPHPIDPRAIHCQRYCGGPAGDHKIHKSSFTLTTNKMEQPQATVVTTDENSF